MINLLLIGFMPETHEWKTPAKQTIPGRSFHSVVCWRKALFMFGGVGATNKNLGDLLQFGEGMLSDPSPAHHHVTWLQP